jgi:HCOMODA/2-hydroxy-3-carboxy-muconic semialdehyde decarboxylase
MNVNAARALTIFLAAGLLLLTDVSSHADPAPAPVTRQSVIDDLVVGNHILADLGVVDGFGHLTARDPDHPDHFLMSRSLAPALVKAEDIMEFDRDGNPVDQQGRAIFLERFIHAEVYKARPDVMAVVHTHSANVIPFSDSTVPMRAMFHSGAFLAAGVPVFELRDQFGQTDMLIRNNEIGAALAKTLADKNVALIRGHGDVVVASSIPMAVFRAYYTDLNAKLEAQAIALGGSVNYLTPEEGLKADGVNVLIMPRAWDLWKRNEQAKPAPH